MNDTELAGLDALPSEMEARALTESIKSATARVFGALADVEVAITEAYRRRAWASLGYESWETYCAAEFSETRLWASVEERHQQTLKLREAGMSQRAIAAVLGVSKGTVHSELSTAQNWAVDSRGQGLDGRERPARRGLPRVVIVAGLVVLVVSRHPSILCA